MSIAEPREFRVHARHLDHHHGHLVRETSFEAAAMAYLDDLAPTPDEGHEVSIVVQEVETGREHCFRIDLDTGSTAPCA